MKDYKNTTIKLLQSFILMIIFIITILSNSIYEGVSLQKSLSKEDKEKGFIQLRDNYDGTGSTMSINEFFKKSDSIEKMKKLYNSISENSDFKYYEIGKQRLELHGDFKGDSSLIEDSQERENGDIIVRLKSIQLGEKVNTYFNMEGKINDGKYFSKEDYYFNSNNKVPVILGELYSNTYSIGDSFEVNYLGNINLKCNVIGFFKKDSSFNINQEYNLDDKIVMPSLNIKSDVSLENKKFEQILYSIKNNGYMPYNSDDEYKNCTNFINEIASKIDIDWGYMGKAENPFKKNTIKVPFNTIKFIRIMAWIISLILIIFIYKLEKQIYRKIDFSKSKKQIVLLQTKKSAIMALQIAIGYIITCFIINICFKNSSVSYVLGYMEKHLIIFLLFGFIMITYALNRYVNKNIKHK